MADTPYKMNLATQGKNDLLANGTYIAYAPELGDYVPEVLRVDPLEVNHITEVHAGSDHPVDIELTL